MFCFFKESEEQRVTKRCRLSWLTNSALVYEPLCGEKGGGGGCGGLAIKYNCAHGAQINFGDLTPYLTCGEERDADQISWLLLQNLLFYVFTINTPPCNSNRHSWRGNRRRSPSHRRGSYLTTDSFPWWNKIHTAQELIPSWRISGGSLRILKPIPNVIFELPFLKKSTNYELVCYAHGWSGIMLQGRVTSLKEKLEQVSKSEAAWEHKFKMADTELTRAKQGRNTMLHVCLRMRSSQTVRASDCQCQSRNSPGFDPSILRHSEIWGAADEEVLNKVHTKKPIKSPCLCMVEKFVYGISVWVKAN